jgi:hypothetical protein
MSDEPSVHNIGNRDVVKPRVNGARLKTFINHEVTLVGTVLSTNDANNEMVVAAADEAYVTVC